MMNNEQSPFQFTLGQMGVVSWSLTHCELLDEKQPKPFKRELQAGVNTSLKIEKQLIQSFLDDVLLLFNNSEAEPNQAQTGFKNEQTQPVSIEVGEHLMWEPKLMQLTLPASINTEPELKAKLWQCLCEQYIDNQ